MIVEELIVYGKQYIDTTYVEMLLANILNINALELLLNLDKKLTDEEIGKFKQQVIAIKNKEPIQYVIGNVDFYGNLIEINPNVLIPRFETEQLVEKTIGYIKKYFNDKIDIVDLGTGSGCIAITLKKELNSNVDAVDISDLALEVAKNNIIKHNLDINLIKGNMLDPLTKKYDLIISNPPYIAYDEEIMDIVKNNEPDKALYASDNGLFYYKEIIKNSKNYLKEKNIIALEIGSKQGNEIEKFAKEYYPEAIITLEKDLQDLDRFIFILNI